jgi:hypothetical protein
MGVVGVTGDAIGCFRLRARLRIKVRLRVVELVTGVATVRQRPRLHPRHGLHVYRVRELNALAALSITFGLNGQDQGFDNAIALFAVALFTCGECRPFVAAALGATGQARCCVELGMATLALQSRLRGCCRVGWGHSAQVHCVLEGAFFSLSAMRDGSARMTRDTSLRACMTQLDFGVSCEELGVGTTLELVHETRRLIEWAHETIDDLTLRLGRQAAQLERAEARR